MSVDPYIYRSSFPVGRDATNTNTFISRRVNGMSRHKEWQAPGITSVRWNRNSSHDLGQTGSSSAWVSDMPADIGRQGWLCIMPVVVVLVLR